MKYIYLAVFFVIYYHFYLDSQQKQSAETPIYLLGICTAQVRPIRKKTSPDDVDIRETPRIFLTSLHHSYYESTIRKAKTKVIARLYPLLTLYVKSELLENFSMTDLLNLEKTLLFLGLLRAEYIHIFVQLPIQIICEYLHDHIFLTAIRENDRETIYTFLHNHNDQRDYRKWKKIFRHKNVFVLAPHSFLKDKFRKRKLKEIPKRLGAKIASCVSDKKISAIEKILTDTSPQHIVLALPQLSIKVQKIIKQTNTPVFVLPSLKTSQCCKQLILQFCTSRQ